MFCFVILKNVYQIYFEKNTHCKRKKSLSKFRTLELFFYSEPAINFFNINQIISQPKNLFIIAKPIEAAIYNEKQTTLPYSPITNIYNIQRIISKTS